MDDEDDEDESVCVCVCWTFNMVEGFESVFTAGEGFTRSGSMQNVWRSVKDELYRNVTKVILEK